VDYNNFMYGQCAGQQNSSGLGNMLGGLADNCVGVNSYMGVANYQPQYTPEEQEARRKQREEEEAMAAQEFKESQERIERNRPKMLRWCAGSVFFVATVLFLLVVNLSFPNKGYNAIMGSAILWFLTVCSVGGVGFSVYFANFYSK
jgi:hypothetical protein